MRHDSYFKVVYKGRRDEFVFFRANDSVDTARALQIARAEAMAYSGAICVWKRSAGVGPEIRVIGESEPDVHETIYA